MWVMEQMQPKIDELDEVQKKCQLERMMVLNTDEVED